MSTNLSRSDTCLAVAEDVGRDQIDPAEDEDDDAGGDDDTPESEAERLLACGRLIEIAKHVDAEHLHSERKEDEAMGRTEKGPVAGEVTTDGTELPFRDQEEHCFKVSIACSKRL